MDCWKNCRMHSQRYAAARGSGGIVVPYPEGPHGLHCRAGLPLGRKSGILVHAPAPDVLRQHLGRRWMCDCLRNGNSFRCISGPALPLLCAHDDRHSVFPRSDDDESDAMGVRRRMVSCCTDSRYSHSANNLPESRCQEICIESHHPSSVQAGICIVYERIPGSI